MMEEEVETQIEYAIWVNIEDRILTFCDMEGYEKLNFRTQEHKMAHVYDLCESGYRIL